jgi:signal transduction histidine kinase/ActR/RegA family two-component response regulator
MTFQGNVEAVPFGVAAAIAIVLALLTWERRVIPRARAFAVMMFGEAIWALSEALELLTVELPFKIIWFEVRAFGAMVTIVSLLAFVLVFTGRERWLLPRRFLCVVVPAIVLTLIAWTNSWHHTFWAQIWNERIGEHWIAMPSYGPFFWIAFVYSYSLVAVSAFLLAEAVWRSTGIFREQAAIMLFGVLLPWLVNFVDMAQIFGFIHVDTVAIAFAVTGLIFFPGVFRYRLLDLAPVAWAAVVDGMDDPVVVIDPWGRICDLNPAAQKLAHGSRIDLLGIQVDRALGHWPALAKRLLAISTECEASFEIEGPDPADATWFDARISRLARGSRECGWVLVLRDITPHKRAALERSNAMREHTARTEAEASNQSKDQFLAKVSHELRTPLNPVLATVTALLEDPVMSPSLRSALEMIQRNVILESRLIDDLLDFARIGRGKLTLHPELVDAHELINQVVRICQDEIRTANLQLDVYLSARRHHLDADPVRIQQVLWNLIKNAIKFTPAGGSITVRSSNNEGRDNGTGQAVRGNRLVIEVSDTGIGVAPEDVARIFEVFEQGDAPRAPSNGGLGLGLSISRSIVEQHGGKLTASSAGPGHGASFSVDVPAVATHVPLQATESASATPHAYPGSEQQPLRILLVDDNQDTLNYLSRLLSLRGYRVLTASSRANALQLAAEKSFDLLISDIDLADGSGLELIWNLRSQREVPAIALSGFGSSDDIEMSRSAGFALHLTKPVDFRLLVEAIQQLVEGSPSTSSFTSITNPG